MSELIDDWKEEDVISYPKSLPSFDDLMSEIGNIELKN